MRRATWTLAAALLLFSLSSWGQMILTPPPTLTLPAPGENGSMMISNGTDWVTDTNPAVKVDGSVRLTAPLQLYGPRSLPTARVGDISFSEEPAAFWCGYPSPGPLHQAPIWRQVITSNELVTALEGYVPLGGEEDPVVGAVTGIVQADGAGTISAVSPGGITPDLLSATPSLLGNVDVNVDFSNSSFSMRNGEVTEYVTNLTTDGAITGGYILTSGGADLDTVASELSGKAAAPASLPVADGTYTFDAATPGNVSSITVSNGIITVITVVPGP